MSSTNTPEISLKLCTMNEIPPEDPMFRGILSKTVVGVFQDKGLILVFYDYKKQRWYSIDTDNIVTDLIGWVDVQ